MKKMNKDLQQFIATRLRRPLDKVKTMSLQTILEDYDKKVQYTNKLLETTCRKQLWQFIKHSNINKSHLNQGGLHLNRRGTAVLAQNIKHCIQTLEKN